MKEKVEKTRMGQKKGIDAEIPTKEKATPQTLDGQRREALRYYLMGLNLVEISLLLGGVAVRTLERWQQSDKWTAAKNPKTLPIKERIAEMHKAGNSLAVIAAKVGKSKTTVGRYVRDLEAN